MKKLISVVLVLIIILCCVSTTIYATGEVISSSRNFLKTGEGEATENIKGEDLQDLSSVLHNTLLIIGIIIAIIVGAILGIKFILSGIEEKAEVKKTLIAYIVGCVVVFGAFAIWELIVTLLNTTQ